MKKHIPNMLTLFRIALVPIFVYLIFGREQIFPATIVFVIASITDFFDGLLARKFNVISDFGKIMDPLADKILVISALFALAVPPINFISIVVFFIIISREIAVTILRNVYAKKEIYIPANFWGKLKTTLQMIGIIGAFLYKSLTEIRTVSISTEANVVLLIQVYFWLVVVITILSGMHLFRPVGKVVKT